MPGDPIRLGPFVGGINQLSDPTALQDNELVDAVNLELDLDGSYIGRPPFFDIGEPSTGIGLRLLGYFVTSTHTRLIACNSTGIWSYEAGIWTSVAGTSTLIATTMVQYNDFAWIIASPLSPVDGGSLSDALAFATVASVKRGGSAVIHKERLFIVPGPDKTGVDSTLLYGSEPANFGAWPVAVYINKGDGQKLIDIIVYNDNLLLFKEDSTYVLAYDDDPSAAITRKINSTIGVANLNCVVSYENQLYLLHRNNVYEITNYDFAKINSKVPFVLDTTKPSPWTLSTFLTLLGDRLIVRYHARLYVFGLKTKVWTRWELGTRYIGPAVATPIRNEATAIPEYIMASNSSASDDVHSFRDVIDSLNSEDIAVTIKTKNYDYGVPHRYKRLMWWGANVSAISEITGIVQPVVIGFSVTWDALALISWDDLETWDQLTTQPVIIQTDVPPQSSLRKFAKFMKSLRFRQVNYQVDFSYDGTDVTGPIRFFDLTTIIGTKQHSSKALT